MKISKTIVLLVVVVLLGAYETVQSQDLPLSMILIDGEKWELVSSNHSFTEGPAVNAAGEVFFTDVTKSEIYKVDLTGKVTLWSDQTNQTAGAIMGPGDVLYGASIGGGAIVKFDAAGKPTPIVSDIVCNDLVVNGAGGVYFTDHKNKKVWHVSPQGKLQQVDQNMTSPNGIILWPDQKQLIVSNTKGSELWTYRIEADGSLSHKQAYSTMRLPVGEIESGADGMTVDVVGRL
jgi:gluconolactonase